MKLQIGELDTGDPEITLLTSMFRACVEAAMPINCLPALLPNPAPGRTVVVGAGKAAHEMARAVEECWPGHDRISGAVTVPQGTPFVTGIVAWIEATHPVPGPESVAAARASLTLVEGLSDRDMVLCLISGGASSLWALPPDSVGLDAKIAVNRALLKSGAAIGEMNVVRKHLSRIKGGRLAVAAAPAKVLTVAISDIPGDAPDAIGSGPTVGDPSTGAEALEILQRYGIDAGAEIYAAVGSPANETNFPDHPVFAGNEYIVAAGSDTGLRAAETVARRAGYEILNLGGELEGEARDVGRDHAALVGQIRDRRGPVAPPCVIVSGGETSVTVTGGGRGGRNTEYCLALLEATASMDGIYALACDTDGIDGSSDCAGAIVTPLTQARAEANPGAPGVYLEDNDSHGFFERYGGLVRTGPTGTNINDLRAIIVS